MKLRRFKVETIIENGMGHYKITDQKTGKIIHCDFGELNNILYELMEEQNNGKII